MKAKRKRVIIAKNCIYIPGEEDRKKLIEFIKIICDYNTKDKKNKFIITNI